MKQWSASKINTANYCRRKYFLTYVPPREKGLIFSSYRRGTLIHNIIETFWKKLGEPHEIKRTKKGKVRSKKKYSNAQEFVEFAQGQWLYMMNQDEASGREIEWKFDNEKWVLLNGYIPQVCEPLFHQLIKEGPPIASELKFKFILGNRKFIGFIDEVRLAGDGTVVIRDYKTEKPWMHGMKLSGNPQLTLYCVGLCAMCHGDRDFAKKVGLEDEADKFLGKPLFISDRVRPEFFMVDTLRFDPEETTNMPQLKYPTRRTDRDFTEVLRFVMDIENLVKDYYSRGKDRIPPTERGRKCDYCDKKVACLRRLEEELNQPENENFFKGKDGQLFFKFASPYAPKKEKPKDRQKRLRWKRKKKVNHSSSP